MVARSQEEPRNTTKPHHATNLTQRFTGGEHGKMATSEPLSGNRGNRGLEGRGFIGGLECAQ